MASPREVLRRRLAAGERLVSIGAWDVLSAKVVAHAGYDMVALQSFQYAAGWGVPDVGVRTPSDLLDLTFKVAGEVDLPILVDLEDGFGSPGHAAYWAREFERAGAAMIHIDDGAGVHSCPWLPGAGARIVRAPVELTSAMIEAIAAERRDGLVISARVKLNPDEDPAEVEQEELERLRAYTRAGADVVFAPKSATMRNDMDRLRAYVASSPCPVAIQFNPPGYIASYVPRGASSSRSIADRSFAELFEAGVALINSPQLYPVAYRALLDVLAAVRREGSLQPASAHMLSLEQVSELVGYERFAPRAVERERG